MIVTIEVPKASARDPSEVLIALDQSKQCELQWQRVFVDRPSFAITSFALIAISVVLVVHAIASVQFGASTHVQSEQLRNSFGTLSQ